MAAHEPLRRIGPFSVGPIGFGCWRLTTPSTAEAAALVEAAVDLGCTLVDTADVYGLDWGGTGFGTCEERLGDVLRNRPGLRDRMVLATKGGIIPGVPYDSSPAALTAACEASLRRLGVDHVDLYQVHRPDMFAHPADVAATLASLRERGLAREVGVSNHTPAQTEALQAHLPFALASTQPEFSAACTAPMRDGTLDLAMRHGTAVLAWSPLAGGRLASGEGLRPGLADVLDGIAANHGVDRAAVALAFVLAHPSAPVAIIGTQQVARVAEAVAAASLQLSRSEVYAIVQASEGAPLP
jgi:aryl-alcohol dehydrogenase-like predicted oxidoreductase